MMERLTVALGCQPGCRTALKRYGTGETVSFYGPGVQIQGRLPRRGLVVRELLVAKSGSWSEKIHTLKEFLFAANANRELCIALRVNRQNASPPVKTGEGSREVCNEPCHISILGASDRPHDS